MAASFKDCSFKITNPKYLYFDDSIKIAFNCNANLGKYEKIVFWWAIFTDKLGNKYSWTKNEQLFALSKKKFMYPFDFRIYGKGKKLFIKGATVTLVFLTVSGIRADVIYEVGADGTLKLQAVNSFSMDEKEKKAYWECLTKEPITPSIGGDDLGGGQDGNPDIIDPVKTIPELGKYIKALQEEKKYLMLGGGKKYKVTNGHLLSRNNNVYSYLFDLEAELYLADDAPVKVSAGYDTASGSVLMCEDFQVIVQLETSLGESVKSATISVEPWKLLEALENRLNYGIGLKGNKMAQTILKTGPSLMTSKDVYKIPKGQDAVIKKAMSEPVTIVWGPPGTGKTHTMSEMAIRFIEKGYSVLIVSHSNVSVDGVSKKIDELLKKKGKKDVLEEGKVLRYGYVRDEQLNKNPYVSSFYFTVTKNPKLKAKLDELQDEFDEIKKAHGLKHPDVVTLKEKIGEIRSYIKEQEIEYVKKASIVTTTISKAVIDKSFENRKFDVVMFDEVSMAYVLQVVAAATFAKKHMICVGDFMQLAPIAQSKASEILCEDIFTYLGINKYGEPHYHPWLVMLNEQRRMHPKISKFANNYVYKHLLKDYKDVEKDRETIVEAPLFSGEALNLIDLFGSYCAASKNVDNSRYNILSALIAFSVAIQSEEKLDTVSIITPYAAQTRLVRALVLDYRANKKHTELRCATVHQFQGSESDLIVFDPVESYPAKKPGWLMGKDYHSILRLINVAVTRARGKLVTVANRTFWDNNYKGTSHTYYKLQKYLETNGLVTNHQEKSLDKLIPELSVKGGPQFFDNPDKYILQLKKDIEGAKSRIIVSLPSGELDSLYQKTTLNSLVKAKSKGIPVLVKCNSYSKLPEEWKTITRGTDNATFPIIMIDDRITWYGAPLAKWALDAGKTSYNSVVNVACRIKGEHTAEIICSLSELDYIETEGGIKPLLPKPDGVPTSMGYKKDISLSTYVKENKKCPSCKKPVVMTKGKSGKTILWCKDCKKTMLLTPDDVNHYISHYNVICPKDNGDLKAKVGKYGLYIQCSHGHFLKPEEI